LTRGVAHEGGRALCWVVLAALIFNLRTALPFARILTRGRRIWWLVDAVVSPVLSAAGFAFGLSLDGSVHFRTVRPGPSSARVA